MHAGCVQTHTERERSRETMSNPDFLFSLALHFDDPAIAALRAEPGPFTSILTDAYLWYKRTELLCSSKLERDVELQQRPGADWEVVYTDLQGALGHKRPLCVVQHGVSASVLLELGSDPSNGNALWNAISEHRDDVARVLLSDGRSDPNVYDEDDEDAPLHFTVARGDVEFTRLLLANPRTDPDQDNDGEDTGPLTPIENACRWMGEGGEDNWNDIAECIRLVLGDPRTQDFDGLRLLSLSDYNPVIIQVVIHEWSREQRDHTDELDALCSRGYSGVVALLLKHCQCDPARDDSRCLRLAVERRFSTVVKILLSDGRANPRADNDFCIEEACALGDFWTVSALLSDKRAVSDANNDAPMRVAQENGHTCVVALLQSHRKPEKKTRRRRRCARYA